MSRLLLFVLLAFVSVSHASELVRRGNYAIFIPPFGGAAPSKRSFLSPNGKFQVEIENREPGQTSETKITVTVYQVGSSTALWINNATGMPADVIQSEDIVISEEGTFFLLASADKPWTLFRKNRLPESIGHFYHPGDPRIGRSSEKFLPADLIEIDQLNAEPIIRIWHGTTDQWEAFRIEDKKEIQVPPSLASKWNSIAREKILAKLARLRHDNLRRKLGTVSPALSNFATNLAPAIRFGDIRMVDFQFLALRRIPADHHWFQEMIKPLRSQTPTVTWTGRTPGSFGQTYSYSSQNALTYSSSDYERLIGDTLLALFENKASAKDLYSFSAFPRKLFYLGQVAGTVKLPSLPKAQETLRIWLIPKNDINADWSTDGAELVETKLKWTHPNTPAPGKEILFNFQNVLPGEYMLKAILDKRPSFEDRQRAGPGDYESGWVGPITITAGNMSSDIVAVCTNRSTLPGGEAYYAADEISLRLKSPPQDGRAR